MKLQYDSLKTEIQRVFPSIYPGPELQIVSPELLYDPECQEIVTEFQAKP